MYSPADPRSIERYSSAVTLSDMELFIFPETMMALVLANIMSPAIWRWRQDSWFAKSEKMSPYRRILRLKQYIMDRFAFNLDLDTWGLTTKEKELARFSGFIDEATLAQSNALFGYEGDKYYFDIDIRRHFGLDKYTSDIIPYWKTETVEAMEAFKFKPGYGTGAGECVSLSSLYAAALFVVAGIPLEKIFLMATPLHSQNFIDINEGILTNNRRIVTKNMWFNGTEITAKAQRALRNERVTIVVHSSGHIHTVYREASIDPSAYRDFSEKLNSFLTTHIDYSVLASFLREKSGLQKCFQFSHTCCGKARYIQAEKVYAYEHNSKSRVGDETQIALLHEIDEDEFYPEPLPSRIIFDELQDVLTKQPVNLDNIADIKKHLHCGCLNTDEVMRDLRDFCRITPRLPDPASKSWVAPQPIGISEKMTREEIIAHLESIRGTNSVADLAFTAFRDLRRAPWKPFLKAALERSPVSIAGAGELDLDQVHARLSELPQESIYAEPSRLAQPDEVWNYGRGDGVEKAICLMNIARSRGEQPVLRISDADRSVVVTCKGRDYSFPSTKSVPQPMETDF